MDRHRRLDTECISDQFLTVSSNLMMKGIFMAYIAIPSNILLAERARCEAPHSRRHIRLGDHDHLGRVSCGWDCTPTRFFWLIIIPVGRCGGCLGSSGPVDLLEGVCMVMCLREAVGDTRLAKVVVYHCQIYFSGPFRHEAGKRDTHLHTGGIYSELL